MERERADGFECERVMELLGRLCQCEDNPALHELEQETVEELERMGYNADELYPIYKEVRKIFSFDD